MTTTESGPEASARLGEVLLEARGVSKFFDLVPASDSGVVQQPGRPLGGLQQLTVGGGRPQEVDGDAVGLKRRYAHSGHNTWLFSARP